jgi:hypothetical protein
MPKAVSNPVTSAVTSTAPQTAPPAEATPRALLVVAAIVGAEALVGLGYGVYLLVEALFGTPRDLGQAIAVGVTVLILALPLPLVAKGLTQAKMWSRTPAVMVQLLALWMAYFMVQANNYAAAVPTTAVAVAGLVGIFLPASTSALTRHWRE